jgi:hypothetical protein
VEIPGPQNLVGVIPGNYPADQTAVNAMMGHQITALEREFNLPVGYFGVAGVPALLPSRRTRVMEYLCD